VNQSFGTHYYEFTVPADEGVYEYQTVCDIGARNVTKSKAFHVSGAFRETLEAIAARIDIVPQGVSQVELSSTAAESWLFNTDDWIDVEGAYCSVYELQNNTREFVIGQFFYDDFVDQTFSEWNKSYPDSTNAGYEVFDSVSAANCDTYNCARGQLYNVSEQMFFGFAYYSGSQAFALKSLVDEEITGDWSLSFDVKAYNSFGLNYDTFGFMLLGSDADGSYLMSDSSIAAPLNPRAANNAMLAVQVNANIVAGGKGWASIPVGYANVGTGNLYVYRNSTYENTSYRWVRTNATFGVAWQTLTLAKRGDHFSFYRDGTLYYEWDDVLPEDPQSIVFSGLVGDVAPRGFTLDNVEIVRSVDDNYEFGLGSKLFTYYWFTDSRLVSRGENYVVDCDVQVEQSKGVKSIYDLVQYLYINRAGRIRAVTVK